MKNLKHISLLIILTLSMHLAACGQESFDQKVKSLYKGTVPLIYAPSLDVHQSNLMILDTRSPEEYAISHLQNAQQVNYKGFEKDKFTDVPKNTPIVVYCSVGYRSERIGEKLIELGFTDVKNLYGGIFDWKNRGLLIYNTQGQQTDSVHTYNKNWSQWLYNGIKIYE